jgi:hypothetical protein
MAILFVATSLSCSSSLGGGTLDIPREGVSAPVPCSDPTDTRPLDACPGNPDLSGQKSLGTLDTLSETAQAAYGASSSWSGRIIGRGILRNGTVAQGDVSGWVTSFCDEINVLVFDTTGGTCRVQNRCDCIAGGTCTDLACTAANQTAFPAIDSDLAIAAAYPNDASDTTYELVFDIAVGNWWQVSRSVTPGESVRVDASTGASLP